MFKLLFCFFLTIHMLGDFYFQGRTLSAQKQGAFRYVVLHGLIYLAVSAVCVLPCWSLPLLVAAVLLALVHFAVDAVKFLLTKNRGCGPRGYLIDQGIHLLCIFGVTLALCLQGFQLALLPGLDRLLQPVCGDAVTLFQYLGAILVTVMPAQITVRKLTERYRPEEKEAGDANGAGTFIGILERFTILLFLTVHQYAAIGLVLTAKSVARYNKISEDKAFAEYYLIGTLLSTLFAIVSYYVFL